MTRERSLSVLFLQVLLFQVQPVVVDSQSNFSVYFQHSGLGGHITLHTGPQVEPQFTNAHKASQSDWEAGWEAEALEDMNV